jgi:hypothetical protein
MDAPPPPSDKPPPAPSWLVPQPPANIAMKKAAPE